MEELLERAEEDVGEAAEYQHKLSLYAAMHPELDYDCPNAADYPVDVGKDRIRAEAGIVLYQKLVHDALVSASKNIEKFEDKGTQEATAAQEMDDKHWDRRIRTELSYDEIVEEVAIINAETKRTLGIDLFEKTETLEPVGTTPLNNLAD